MSNGEKFLPIGRRWHVVPGLERGRERADVRVAEQHRDFKSLEPRVAEIIDSQFGADLTQYFLETGLFGFQPPLQRATAQQEDPTGGIGIGFTGREQFGQPAPELRSDIILFVQGLKILFRLLDQLSVHRFRPHSIAIVPNIQLDAAISNGQRCDSRTSSSIADCGR